MPKHIPVVATAVSLLAGAAQAAAEDADAADSWSVQEETARYAPTWTEDEGWRFSVTPYVFLPTIDATLRYDTPPGTGGRPRVSVDAQDILEDLNLAFMLTADAHKGRYGVLTDIIYVDLDQEASVDRIVGPGGLVAIPVDVDSSSEVKSWVWTLALGVRMGAPSDRNPEAFAGFRYLRADTTLNWSFVGPLGLFPRSGSFSQEEDVWDAIFGVRGRAPFGESERWALTYYVDVGGGDSDLTWQAVAGIAYAYDWGDLRVAWRHLQYEQSPDKLINDMTLSGPAFGATFRF